MTTFRIRREPLDALSQDIAVGLHTVTEINQSIRYADTKAAGLATVQALAVTVLAAKRDSAGGIPLVIVGSLCLCGVLVSVLLLAAGQVPRLTSSGRGAGSRIAFPALAALPLDEVLQQSPPAQLHEQVWLQAAELATIAVSKFRWLRRALVSTVLTLTAVLLWLISTTWIS
ncbi:Pycsar system effector family protein [Actinoplanes sp. NPDC051859]|uniref:Pycsar system effector family protein n=1 Tax=Actinoplanes sp. NPDC051859 TaxID=3363909 RepID=UPI0037B51CAC